MVSAYGEEERMKEKEWGGDPSLNPVFLTMDSGKLGRDQKSNVVIQNCYCRRVIYLREILLITKLTFKFFEKKVVKLFIVYLLILPLVQKDCPILPVFGRK